MIRYPWFSIVWAMYYPISKHVRSKRADVFYATIFLVYMLMLPDPMLLAKFAP